MSAITFTVTGAAAPQGSKRHVGRGVMAESSKRLKPWRSDVRDAAFMAMDGDPLAGPVAVAATFVYRRPAGHSLSDGISLSAAGKRAPYPPKGGRGDVDKLLRAVLDAMTGIVYADDGQVVVLRGLRAWGPRDEAIVVVVPIAQVVAA